MQNASETTRLSFGVIFSYELQFKRIFVFKFVGIVFVRVRFIVGFRVFSVAGTEKLSMAFHANNYCVVLVTFDTPKVQSSNRADTRPIRGMQ